MAKISRALISVSDKTGIVKFSEELNKMGVEIISTGGTAKKLKESGIPVIDIGDFTGFPELMGGRVKTLHPKVHAALLAKREDSAHMKEVKKHKIQLIDMVVVNLYPFEETVSKPNITEEEIIEQIDIGGPSMLRSAAKNYQDVVVVSNPKDYDSLLEEMKNNGGEIGSETRHRLAQDVFAHTSRYDNVISNYFAGRRERIFPEIKTIKLEKIQDLRYGENPHQLAAFYREIGVRRPPEEEPEVGIAETRQLHGKELSFNNIIDLEAAFSIVVEFDEPCSVIIKHTNPCGVACDKLLNKAYRKAHSCDPVSAFGSIVGFNREVDKATAEEINKTFVELVVAPSFSEDALKILKQKKNIRLLLLPDNWKSIKKKGTRFDYKKVSGGVLIQERDMDLIGKELKVVSKRKPSGEEEQALMFAWKVCKHVKSNSIVFTNKDQTLGIGAGQMSRVDAVRLANMKMSSSKDWGTREDKAKKSVLVMASDAFFPFRDGIDVAAKTGATAVIQPGGALRDLEVIAAIDEHNMAMVFTGMRHFTH